MNHDTNLQKLKYYINESIISKENVIASRKKEYSHQNLKMREDKLSALEEEVAKEEDLSHRMLKTSEHLYRLSLNRDLKNQIDHKKLKEDEERAEGVVESLTAKSMDREFYRELEKNRNEKVIDKEIEDFNKHQDEYRRMKIKKGKEKEAVILAAHERYSLLTELQKEYQNQKEERKKLEKQGIAIDLGLSLQKTSYTRDEVLNLREEEQVMLKEKKEEEEAIKNKDNRRQHEQRILKDREEQIRIKEELRKRESERATEYVRLLTDLLAEEEGLDRMRSDVASRKKREHYVVAQKIVEERKRRKEEEICERNYMAKKEKQLTALRDSLLKEEEKKLLLQYLPHLGPHLSPYMLEKLASL